METDQRRDVARLSQLVHSKWSFLNMFTSVTVTVCVTDNVS